jgi:protein O-mannosyl-transferase
MKSKTLSSLLVIFCLTAAIAAIYGQVQHFDFINLDDNYYVVSNPHIRNGFTLENIKWAFTSTDVGQWIPLVWLSYMLDSHLFGLSPGWFHTVNIFFHIANSVLLFLVLNKMTGKFWESGIVAILFAVHPIHVESVAWVTERKDVLSMFFFLICIFAYAHHATSHKKSYYVLSIIIFALGTMAKPMLVTLPFILILLDFWPLRRFTSWNVNNGKDNKNESFTSFLFIEKIPYIVISLIISSVTLYSAKKGGAIIAADFLPWDIRSANAISSYAAYLLKMLWPSKLAVPYPYREVFIWRELITAASVLILITAMAIKTIHQKPYLIVGWLWYLIMLFPVIGIAQAGTQAMADRFMYIPSMGIYIFIVWSISELAEKVSFPKSIRVSTAISITSILSMVSYLQVQHWHNSITLFKHSASVTKNNFIAYFNLGDAFQNQKKIPEAIQYYLNALELKPDDARTQSHLGLAYMKSGEIEKAISHFEKAVWINPIPAHSLKNKPDSASIRHDFSELADSLNNLGVAFWEKGEIEAAIFYFRESLKADPEYEKAELNLEKALEAKQ